MMADVSASPWMPSSNALIQQSPLARGTVLASGDETDKNGDLVHSNFLETNLKHPLVRVDENSTARPS